MKFRSVITASALVIAGMLSAPVAAGAAPVSPAVATTDTVAPIGTYKLDQTVVYLRTDDDFETGARVRITQISLDDKLARRYVVAQPDENAVEWVTGSSYYITYTTPGTYRPTVYLRDPAGNTREVIAGTVVVKSDTAKPRLTVTVPKKPSKVASWKVLRRTAADLQTGLLVVGAYALQKRGKLWYAYDFKKRTWVKGKSTAKATAAKSKATPAIVQVNQAGGWKTPAIKGLKKGRTQFQALAYDGEFNQAFRIINRTLR